MTLTLVDALVSSAAERLMNEPRRIKLSEVIRRGDIRIYLNHLILILPS